MTETDFNVTNLMPSTKRVKMGWLGRMGNMQVEVPNNVTIAVRSDGIFLTPMHLHLLAINGAKLVNFCELCGEFS